MNDLPIDDSILEDWLGGPVPEEKLKEIREGKDPIQAKVFYEYGAVLKTLVEELGYDNFNIDGDHGIGVVNIKDILEIIKVLEEMK